MLTAQVEYFQALPAKNTNASGVLPKRPDMTERHNKSSDSEKTINLRTTQFILGNQHGQLCLHMKPMND